MHKIIHKKTQRKFYNKFIYKLSLKMPGVHALRWADFNGIINICRGDDTFSIGRYANQCIQDQTYNDLFRNKEEWINLGFLLARYDKSVWSKRVEGDMLDLYTSDENLFKEVYKDLQSKIKVTYTPDEDIKNDLVNGKNLIFVKKLPHDRYNYKVYLKPHKLSTNIEFRQTLCNYLETLVPSITFSESVKRWVLTTTENWDRRYIYVEDDKTLLLLKLRDANLIGKVMNYRLR